MMDIPSHHQAKQIEQLRAENARLREELHGLNIEFGDVRDSYDHFKAEAKRLREELAAEREKVKELEDAQAGVCIKCGNPARHNNEHFVVATASEGVSPPEDNNPQPVETRHHFSQPVDMVDRIADCLVEDHIALMNELATAQATIEQMREALDWAMGFADSAISDGFRELGGESISDETHQEAKRYWERETKTFDGYKHLLAAADNRARKQATKEEGK